MDWRHGGQNLATVIGTAEDMGLINEGLPASLIPQWLELSLIEREDAVYSRSTTRYRPMAM